MNKNGTLLYLKALRRVHIHYSSQHLEENYILAKSILINLELRCPGLDVDLTLLESKLVDIVKNL